jgi:hypothetical protein
MFKVLLIFGLACLLVAGIAVATVTVHRIDRPQDCMQVSPTARVCTPAN